MPVWSLPPPWHWDSVRVAPGVAGWGQGGQRGLSCLNPPARAGGGGGSGGDSGPVSPASQAAANARGRAERPQSAAASRIIGISLQEAQQILNVSNLNPEEIQKVEASWEPGRDGAGRALPSEGAAVHGGGSWSPVLSQFENSLPSRLGLCICPAGLLREGMWCLWRCPAGNMGAQRGCQAEPAMSPGSSATFWGVGGSQRLGVGMARVEVALTRSFSRQNYDHLFKVNDKSVGGSFYLQSKVSPGRSRAGAAPSPAVLGRAEPEHPDG